MLCQTDQEQISVAAVPNSYFDMCGLPQFQLQTACSFAYVFQVSEREKERKSSLHTPPLH